MQGSELKAGARKLMMDNAPKLFLVGIVFILIATVVAELQFRLPGISTQLTLYLEQISAGMLPDFRMLYGSIRLPGVALASALMLMMPVVQVGFMSYCLKVARDSDGDFKDIMDGFLFFGKVMLITIITTFLRILWTLLLIFPGIVASYRYRQAYYILLDDPDKSALQCIQESAKMMRGYKLDLFLLDLSFLGWFILDFIVVIIIPAPIAIPIVSIWLTPYMGLTRAAYYNRLLDRYTV